MEGIGRTKVWKKGKLLTLRAVGGLFSEMSWPTQGKFCGPGVATQRRLLVVPAYHPAAQLGTQRQRRPTLGQEAQPCPGPTSLFFLRLQSYLCLLGTDRHLGTFTRGWCLKPRWLHMCLGCQLPLPFSEPWWYTLSPPGRGWAMGNGPCLLPCHPNPPASPSCPDFMHPRAHSQWPAPPPRTTSVQGWMAQCFLC